jgi:hypothetical protein
MSAPVSRILVDSFRLASMMQRPRSAGQIAGPHFLSAANPFFYSPGIPSSSSIGILTPAVSMTYRCHSPECRNPPFNTGSCRTTKEINSLMAVGGNG